MIPFLIDSQAIEVLERHPIGNGLSYTELASTDDVDVGLLWLEPKSIRPKHTGTGSVHAWVAAGTATIDGTPGGQGSYYFLPPGERPEVRAGSDGYVVFCVSCGSSS
ncbi:MAG: hypothetical protein H0T59_01275 [Chloroflexi bacterium]|nr:hypothetical protein [Chloroflexota bacterium]